jgi:hypothetical protein
MVARQIPLQRVGDVLAQMEAIRHLARLRRTQPRSFRVGTPRDHG